MARASSASARRVTIAGVSARWIATSGGSLAGRLAKAASTSSASASVVPMTTSSFDEKYRKKLRREMPAARAISPTLVSS